MADEALGGRDAPEHVDEHAHGVVGDIGGIDAPGVGDGDAAARALVEIDVVNAGARVDDATQRANRVEERGVHADNAAPHDDGGARGLGQGRGGGEEGHERLARGRQVEDAEAFAQRGIEGPIVAAEEEERRERLRSRGG